RYIGERDAAFVSNLVGVKDDSALGHGAGILARHTHHFQAAVKIAQLHRFRTIGLEVHLLDQLVLRIVNADDHVFGEAVVLFGAGVDVKNATQPDTRRRSSVEISLVASGIRDSNPNWRSERFVEVSGAFIFVLRVSRGTAAATHVSKLELANTALAGFVLRRFGQNRVAFFGAGTGDDAARRVFQYQKRPEHRLATFAALRVVLTHGLDAEGMAYSQVGFRIVLAGTTRVQRFGGRVDGDPGLGAQLGFVMCRGIDRETILACLGQDVARVQAG